MTAVTTRPPLQVVTNPNAGMSAPRRSTRRSGARLADDDDGERSKAVASFDDTDAAPASRRADVSSVSKTAKRGPAAASATAAASTTGDRRAKRKLDYDEEDDGFAFKRTKSARAKAAPAPAEDEPEAEAEQPPKQLEVRKRRKKSSEPPGPPPAVRRKEGPTTKSAKPASKHASATTTQRTPSPKRGGGGGDVTKVALPFADTPVIRRNQAMRRGDGGDGSRRSSLSMRGRRASSLIESGTSNALPHAEVPTGDFYKHIESGLPEPRRMKQLLTWCATRALGAKPADSKGKSHARLAAYEIKEQILHDFSTQSSLSDWFGREERPAPKQALQPNPRNVANQAKIDELRKRLARLGAERETWQRLLSPAANAPLIPPHLHTRPSPASIDRTLLNDSDRDALALLTSIHPPSSADPARPDISTSAAPTASSSSLSTQQGLTDAAPPSASPPGTSTSPTKPPALTSAPPSTTTTTTTTTASASASAAAAAPPLTAAQTIPARVAHVASTAEFAIDRLADAAHALAQHLTHAERLGRRVLAECAARLAARDRADGTAAAASRDPADPASGDEDVGTRKVLMALSRVLER